MVAALLIMLTLVTLITVTNRFNEMKNKLLSCLVVRVFLTVIVVNVVALFVTAT